GSNGNVSHHGGHGGNRRGDHRHSPDNNNSGGSNTNNNNSNGRGERYSHASGREMNGRNSHGGHAGHGSGGGACYGNRGAMLSREQVRPSTLPTNQYFVSRNHKEIVDFFQHNFEIIKDQTQSGPAHESSGRSSRKAVYYHPPAGLPQAPAVTPSEAGSY
ncbi:hypothetical protein BIW11_07458, partial [Tropilaelaps mercedesae]